MLTNVTTIDTLNSLLRSEVAALETYQQALEKLAGEPAGTQLLGIHRNHQEAANALREHIYRFGGCPDPDAGSRGAFANAVEMAGESFGMAMALQGLKEGELFAARSYEGALLDQDLPAECQLLI